MIGVREVRAVGELVREVARAEVMPRFRRLGTGDVVAKSGPLDLVTVADEAAEVALMAGLAGLFPGCVVVGEEGATRDSGLLGRIGGAGLCFVVDPIDGTSNFASGLPLFGVMVAVVEGGRTVGAVIHDPVGDDSAMAVLGEGAWMERPGGRGSGCGFAGGSRWGRWRGACRGATCRSRGGGGFVRGCRCWGLLGTTGVPRISIG